MPGLPLFATTALLQSVLPLIRVQETMVLHFTLLLLLEVVFLVEVAAAAQVAQTLTLLVLLVLKLSGKP